VKAWLALFLVLPASAIADTKVLITETFDEADSTTLRHGNAVAWSSDVKGSIQVVNDPGLASGKAFKGNKIVGILPFMSLANQGDTVKVSFTFRLAGPIARTLDGFKVGLFEGGDPTNPWFVAAGNGYRWSIATGIPGVVALVQESGGPDEQILSGQDTNFINQSFATLALNDTAKHQAVILLQMKDDNLNLSLTIDGKKILLSNDPLTSSFTPTCFAIRSDANTFFFDDFSVTGKMKSSAPSN
jgi:hypothetical protein